jgi:hypothetical protein
MKTKSMDLTILSVADWEKRLPSLERLIWDS